MNLYRISQTINRGYDTFDSAIVAANSEKEAQAIHPRGSWGDEFPNRPWEEDGTWTRRPDQVEVVLIGTAAEGIQPGVVLASFNAG